VQVVTNRYHHRFIISEVKQNKKKKKNTIGIKPRIHDYKKVNKFKKKKKEHTHNLRTHFNTLRRTPI
jgi:hypothetical protein